MEILCRFTSRDKKRSLVRTCGLTHVSVRLHTYDSLGEAYLVAGEREKAINNYKKSLELNPKNTNATEALKRLGQK